jgi:hypothetical protein
MEIKFYWNGSIAGTIHSMIINEKKIRLGRVVSNEDEAKLEAAGEGCLTDTQFSHRTEQKF